MAANLDCGIHPTDFPRISVDIPAPTFRLAVYPSTSTVSRGAGRLSSGVPITRGSGMEFLRTTSPPEQDAEKPVFAHAAQRGPDHPSFGLVPGGVTHGMGTRRGAPTEGGSEAYLDHTSQRRTSALGTH